MYFCASVKVFLALKPREKELLWILSEETNLLPSTPEAW